MVRVVLKSKALRGLLKCVDVPKWCGTSLHHQIRLFGGVDFECPVTIIGAGPVGLTLSTLLSKLGIQSVMIEKSEKLTAHPQAHFINNRTMEIFRQLNGLDQKILQSQPPLEHWRYFHYCISMTGKRIGTVDHFEGKQGQDQNLSPTTVAHFPQNRLLPLLLETANEAYSKLSADLLSPNHNPNKAELRSSPVLFGYECVGIESSHFGVNTFVARSHGCKLTGSTHKGAGKLRINSDFVVAADGANSFVRREMGVPMEGTDAIQRLVNVHFGCKRLGEELLRQGKGGMLYFVYNKDVVVVIVAHDLVNGEFVAQIPYYPPFQKFEDFTKKVCLAVIESASGLSNLEVEIFEIRGWVMAAKVASKFVCGKNRVLLAGDSCHQFPPAGGFGMNSGIQDAHNLAWKLVRVIRGLSLKDLLLSYEEERKQIAWSNTRLSVKNFDSAVSVPKALGLDPRAIDVLTQSLQNPPLSFLPEQIRNSIFERSLAIGRLQLDPRVLSMGNPIGSARLEAVKQIFENGDSLQLQFPNEDLGFRYLKGALTNEGSEEERSIGNNESKASGRRKAYVASSAPGCRLPHYPMLKIEKGNLVEISTVDLFPMDDAAMTLILPANGDGEEWQRMASIVVEKELSQVLRVCFVHSMKENTPANDKGGMAELHKFAEFEARISTGVYQLVKSNGGKFQLLVDKKGNWWEQCGIAPHGAILVRPDGHVFWRSTNGLDSDTIQILKRELILKLGISEA